jgi:rhamnosyltransferase
LTALKNQTKPVNRIIVYNTEESFFEPFARQYNITEQFPNLFVYHHSKKEFDHGRTRNLGVVKSDADIFVMMTMDAVPADNRLMEALEKALAEEQVAVAYARQLPAADAKEIERFTRQFNYPPQSIVKTKADEERLGIKTYFCSNVCAAYKRKIFDELGGFIGHTIFNEDMIYAGKAVQAGYAIAYTADANVIHSHNYTAKEQFKRNFDLGVSQAEHPEIFEGLKSESEGIRLVLSTQKHLIHKRSWGEIFRLYTSSAAKLAGYRLGKNYRRLPKWFVLKCSMNRDYFV